MDARGERSSAERVGTGFGIFYLVLGLVGFAVTGLSGDTLFRADPGMRLAGILTVNGFHNIVHVAFAAALLVGVSVAGSTGRPDIARGVLGGIGTIELVAAVIGFTGAFVNFLNIPTGPLGLVDNVFHLVTGAALLYFGFAPTAVPATHSQAAGSERSMVRHA